MEIVPTPQDYANLFRVNPLAAEQLKSIVLTRLLEEERKKKEQQPKDAAQPRTKSSQKISDADTKPARAASKR